MIGFLETVLHADAAQKLFNRGDSWVTAGDVRALALRVLPRVRQAQSEIFLHTTSLSRFTAGLLAAAAAGKSVALPAHAQSTYLAELGCPEGALFNDDAFERGDTEGELAIKQHDPLLVLFTSGSTDKPKRIEKNFSRLEIEGRALDAQWGERATHVIATVSHQHIYGMLFRLVWPVLSGRTSDDVAATYWEDLEGRMSGATLASSPAHLTRLAPRADLYRPAPALIFSSGQLLPAPDAAACINAFGKPVIEVFGSTETGGVAWREQATPNAAWTPFSRISVSTGEDRALIVRSPYLQDDAPLFTGDIAEIAKDGTFRLLPRGDRVAKIDGKRVSLTRVEAALVGLPEINAAAALPLPERRDALAAVVALSTEGKQLLDALGAFRFSRHLRTSLAATLEPPERPKHWRFVDAIPADSQGKRILSTLRGLFSAMSDPLEPLKMDIRKHTDTEAEIAFTLPEELVFFRGHFPGRAILPGVAQTHMAVLIAQKLWGDWPSDSNLRKLKFKRVLLPGDAVVLRLKRDPAIGRLTFAYGFRDIDASQGEIGGFTPPV
jgi:acyl-coenzyme A synthetase/AMP-(fatty) acid ligase/3-hydroxymyristoyl/3-hydroxydecanoyl-(acyl carrier protein) dehydratase